MVLKKLVAHQGLVGNAVGIIGAWSPPPQKELIRQMWLAALAEWNWLNSNKPVPALIHPVVFFLSQYFLLHSAVQHNPHWLNINHWGTSILVIHTPTQIYNPCSSSSLFYSPLLPILSPTFYGNGLVWGSCLCGYNCHFTLMTTACGANFSSSWGPDVGWQYQTLAIPLLRSHCWPSQEGFWKSHKRLFLSWNPHYNHKNGHTLMWQFKWLCMCDLGMKHTKVCCWVFFPFNFHENKLSF